MKKPRIKIYVAGHCIYDLALWALIQEAAMVGKSRVGFKPNPDALIQVRIDKASCDPLEAVVLAYQADDFTAPEWTGT